MNSHDINLKFKATLINQHGKVSRSYTRKSSVAGSKIEAGGKVFPMRSPTKQFFENINAAFSDTGNPPKFLGVHSSNMDIGIAVGSGTAVVVPGDTALQSQIIHDALLKYGINEVIKQGTSTLNGASWTETTNAFPARYGHLTLFHDGKMWVIAGGETLAGSNDVWSSDDGKIWTKELADTATPGANQFSKRTYIAGFVYNNKMYVVGGLSSSNSHNDVWSSSDGKIWTKELADTTTPGANQFLPRFGCCSYIYNNKMWLVGGSDNTSYYNDVWSSSDGKIWTKELADTATPGANQFSGRRYLSGFVCNNKMYVVGGHNGNNYYNDVWSSSDGKIWMKELTDTATPGANQFSQRSYMVMLVYDNKMHIVGGYDGAKYYNDVWSSSDGKIWTKELMDTATPGANQFSRRAFGAGLVFKNKLCLAGGYTTTSVGDFWTAEEAITTGLQRELTNNSNATIEIEEAGINTAQPDGTLPQVCIRDLIKFSIQPQKSVTLKYKINAAINGFLTFTKNAFRGFETGFGNAPAEFIDTTGVVRNINPFSSAGGMNCQGAIDDDSVGLIVGTGSVIGWEDSSIEQIPNTVLRHHLQTYTAPTVTADNKTSYIRFVRKFENISDEAITVNQFALAGKNSGNTFILVAGITSKTLMPKDSIELDLTLDSNTD